MPTATTKQVKVPVTERALFARINRVLAKENLKLCKSRSDSRSFRDTGEYYAVDLTSNRIDAMFVDLEKWGRELGVLKAYEEVVHA